MTNASINIMPGHKFSVQDFHTAYYRDGKQWIPFQLVTEADLDTWTRICAKIKTQRMDSPTPNKGDYEFYLKSI